MALPSSRRQALLGLLAHDPGRCADCAWLELLTNQRSVFVRCGKATGDPSFRRYPPLPVVECAGWEHWSGPEGPGTPEAD